MNEVSLYDLGAQYQAQVQYVRQAIHTERAQMRRLSGEELRLSRSKLLRLYEMARECSATAALLQQYYAKD